jgi:hypothetical protein
MNRLSRGKLDARHAEQALKDVRAIREKLKAFPPNKVVWDINNPDARPPWGDEISSDVTDLSNYYLTSRGRDLFEVLIECLEVLRREGGCMTIE